MEGSITACKISLISFTHICIVLHKEGSSLVIHHCTIFEISDETPDIKEGVSSLDFEGLNCMP